MSQSANLGGTEGWIVAISLGVFVTGVTWISRSETESGRTQEPLPGPDSRKPRLPRTPRPRRCNHASSPASAPDARSVLPLEGLLVLLLVAWVVNLAGAPRARNPVPGTLQKAVEDRRPLPGLAQRRRCRSRPRTESRRRPSPCSGSPPISWVAGSTPPDPTRDSSNRP